MWRLSPQFRRRILTWGKRLGLGAAAGLLAAWACLPLVPLPHALFQPPPDGWEFVDRHELPLREVAAAGGRWGRWVSYREIPACLVAATLAAEDKRFWRHPGVDWRAYTRAAWGWLRHRHVVSGGSTITLQLVKMAQPRPRNLRSKIIEAAQALRLEQVWPKERILTEYLNRLDYGNLRAGCASAAEYYFAQPLATLTPAQAAFLAGLPQRPTFLNPRFYFEKARKRQQWILGRMAANGGLSEADSQRALREPIQLASMSRSFQAPHFVDLLQQLRGGATASLAPTGGRVQTTLDLSLNRQAERMLQADLARLRPNHAGNGALVVLENATGEVWCLVGSEDYFAPLGGQVNGAWAPRSAGSTFKPFTYLLALERGATPATVVADIPTDFPTPTGVFTPVNYDRRCHGPVRYRLALANSLNIPAVKVLAAAGGPARLMSLLQAAGLTTLTQPPEFYGLGLTIGNAEARLLELVTAYSCLARLGEYRPYRLLKNEPPISRPVRIADAQAAWLVADILSDNSARALAFGLDSHLRFDFPVACKTGTSSNFRDNWAVGFTPEFTVGVWVGNFDGTPMQGVSGVAGAAPILHEMVQYLRDHFGASWYATPSQVVAQPVHPWTGKLLREDDPAAVREKFLASNLPAAQTARDYDAQGRVILPEEYRSWLAGAGGSLNGQAVALAAPSGLKLIAPLPGTRYFLDPDLPDHGRILPLQATGLGPLAWQSATLPCLQTNGGFRAILSPGRHELAVTDTATGQQLQTWIEVKDL